MSRSPGRVGSIALACALALAGCGGSAPGEVATCEGVERGGVCWVGRDGITVTADRAARVLARARAYWAPTAPDLPGWRVEFRRAGAVVDGETYAGYCWPESRRIVVSPFSDDCFEHSAIIHELGHAWGFAHGDPRMSGEWQVIRGAMEDSGWPGCARALEGDDD